jgi:hypothetical protein
LEVSLKQGTIIQIPSVIKNEYLWKFKKPYRVFAGDGVGDRLGKVEGSFEMTQNCFHTRQLMSLYGNYCTFGIKLSPLNWWSLT